MGHGPIIRNAPNLAGQPCSYILGQPHDLTNFAYRCPRPEMDNGRAKPGAVTSVFFINPLDDFFAAFVFKIDIDIRGLAAMPRDKPFKDHANHIGADVGNAQKIADDRIRRRSATLT